MSKKLSFPKDKIKIVLFEKIHGAAQETFENSDYTVTIVPRAVQGEELSQIIEDAHIIGVRSRTKVREEQFKVAKRLLCIGCFSVGTDQVALDAATRAGVPVFNAPHSSTRSVAELTICQLLSLARRTGDKNILLHQGRWEKSVGGAKEVRNKTLGIVGYGHIGQQVGLIAEALGLNVLFYDIEKKLPLGRAQAVDTMEQVLAKSDFVSLHIPGGKVNEKLFNAEKFQAMKDGASFINLSRGKVVDIDALHDAISSGKLDGAALDVFPVEPEENSGEYVTKLAELPNVILTPHVGGSTEEAQRNIGQEVAHSLIRHLDSGDTAGAVNFPAITLPTFPETHRILNIHENAPGVLTEINRVISESGANIDAQYLSTYGNIGYLIIDVEKGLSDEVKVAIAELPKSIRTRILY